MDERGPVLESALLKVRAGLARDFLVAFAEAEPIIASMPGYLGHELQRCIEHPDWFLLLVRWDSLAAHTEGFRGSPEYARWKALLHHFYDPFPEVLHFANPPR